MKRLLSLLIVLISVVSLSSAQKAKVQTAWNYLKYDELDKARVVIDEASENESTQGMAKTWYYRGLIYNRMFKHEKFGQLEPKALEKAMESFEKCLKIEPNYENKEEVLLEMRKISQSFQIRGIDQFTAKDYTNALSSFEMASTLSPADTNVIFNCALSAEKSGNKEKALSYCDRLISMSPQNTWPYNTKSKIQLANGDTTGSLETVRTARRFFPNDQELIISELNIYLMTSRQKEANDIINIAIDKSPTNYQLYQVKADILSKSGDRAGAISMYNKVIELKPDYADAYYNLGAVYLTMGNEFITKANDLPPSKIKDYDTLKKQADTKFSEALPFLEKAHQLEPQNTGTMQTLSQVYARLNMLDKAGEMRKKMGGN